MPHPRSSGVFQDLPGGIVAFACLLAGIEAAFQLGAAGLIGGPFALGWRVEAMSDLGFSAPLFRLVLTTQRADGGTILRFVAYALVHQNLTHALFGLVLLVALGKAVAERFSQWAVGLVLVVATLAGALAYGLLQDGRTLLVGIYPGVYGLIGAFTFALYAAADGGRSRLMAFRLIGVLLMLQLVFLVLIGGANVWIADLGGFLAGFALAVALGDEGGARLRRLRARIRRR